MLLSRSPSVIAVALQLPDTERQGIPGNRLVEKFPSSTTLWHILRRFESGPFGPPRNFTAKGVPKTGSGDTGSGRLYHQAPAIEAMGRELSSFTDLQKTLGQLGFNAGSIALRLTFRTTDTPLEQAMVQIEEYFKSVENEKQQRELGEPSETVQANSIPPLTSQSAIEPQSPEVKPEPSSNTEEPSTENVAPSELPITEDPTTASPPENRISVIAPPKASTPFAALQDWDEKDYVPSTEDAFRHQARLAKSGRNQRLKADSELIAEQQAQKEKAATVKEVEIKVRFPDQYCVVYKFSDADTALTLYDFVTKLLENETEPFILNFTAATGPKTVPRENINLIGQTGLNLKGKLLVNVLWAQGASPQAREGNFLKPDIKAQAKDIVIPTITQEETQPQSTTPAQPQSNNGKGKGKALPKWLKGLPGKK